MARGWGSKAVESQQADREESKTRLQSASPGETERRAGRRNLELARARARAELALATAPAHRQMLEAAIAALEGQLRVLEGKT